MEKNGSDERRGRWIGGTLLILFGVLLLAGQLLNWTWVGTLIMPLIALVFLVWGLATGKDELLIPGGIFAGLGLGIVMTVHYGDIFGGETTGAVFLLSFALGWVLITVLSGLFTKTTHWWALIPGGIIGLVGGSLLVGESAWQMWEIAGRYWPIILIGIGLYLLFFARPAEKS